MSFVKKTWVNRLSEYPTRRILTDTTTGIEQTVTVSRDEGVVTTEGDAFSAENMNDLEGRIDTAVTGLETSFSNALTALKATAIAQAVGATGSTFTSVIAKLAEIINRGHVSASLTPGNSYTIPAGYHDGAGSVSAVSMTDTYDATSRGTLDMGATNVYRYVNTNLVPNYNSGTSNTITSNGTHDLGETNTVRYVNVNVPTNPGVVSFTEVDSVSLVIGAYYLITVVSGITSSPATPQLTSGVTVLNSWYAPAYSDGFGHYYVAGTFRVVATSTSLSASNWARGTILRIT